MGETRARRDPSAIVIANPPSGATYSIDPTLRREFQTLALRAVTAEHTRVERHIDGRTVGSSTSESAVMWPLRAGRHRISANDPRGRTAEATIVVR